MANFLCKKFNDRSYSIYRSGKQIGNVELHVDGSWYGNLRDANHSVRCNNHSDYKVCFHALVLLLLQARLTKTHPSHTFKYDGNGTNSSRDAIAYSSALYTYTDHYNQAHGQRLLRVTTPRRRR